MPSNSKEKRENTIQWCCSSPFQPNPLVADRDVIKHPFGKWWNTPSQVRKHSLQEQGDNTPLQIKHENRGGSFSKSKKLEIKSVKCFHLQSSIYIVSSCKQTSVLCFYKILTTKCNFKGWDVTNLCNNKRI